MRSVYFCAAAADATLLESQRHQPAQHEPAKEKEADPVNNNVCFVFYYVILRNI